MKMSGTRELPAPREQVWAKLNDPETLQRCIPGCQSLEQVADDKLKATVGLKIGPVNAKFTGEVELSDMDPPNGYRISGSGKGGPAGSASGGADVTLAETPSGGTLLSYDVDAKVAGKIAQLGSRLIDATAASLAEKFFDNLAAELEPEEPADEPPLETTDPLKAAAADAAARANRYYFIGAVIVVVAILLTLF